MKKLIFAAIMAIAAVSAVAVTLVPTDVSAQNRTTNCRPTHAC